MRSRIRSRLKQFAEQSAFRTGLTRLGSGRTRGKVLVLAYHNVVADDAPAIGDRPNHTRLSDFSAQIRLLRRRLDIVPLANAFHEGAERRAVVTFDDAYRGAVRVGVDEIRRQGACATIFVAPSFLGGKAFWWDLLSGNNGLDAAMRVTAIEQLRGACDAILARFPRGEAITHSDFLPASESELMAAASVPGISIGAHSWSHPNLVTLPDDELKAELTAPLTWIRERFDSAIPWLSYPYGSCDSRVMRAAQEAGYLAALGIRGGWSDASPANAFEISRLSVPAGISVDGFGLRVDGWLSK